MGDAEAGGTVGQWLTCTWRLELIAPCLGFILPFYPSTPLNKPNDVFMLYFLFLRVYIELKSTHTWASTKSSIVHLWYSAVSRRQACWTLTKKETPNCQTARSTVACLTFTREMRHINVTRRKRVWLTLLIPCPWRHYKSALPGHWYLWSDTDSALRKNRFQLTVRR